MGALLLLPILGSGFLYCHLHPIYYYRLHRYEGQYLYLQATKLGLISFFVSSVFHFCFLPILYWINNWYGIDWGQDYIVTLAKHLVNYGLIPPESSRPISWLLILSFTSFLIPVADRYLYKSAFRYKHGYATKKVAEVALALDIMEDLFKDSPLDKLLFESLISANGAGIIMLTMADRKVYVGKVLTMGEPNENEGADQEISLKPILSGYRDKDSLKVKFTTPYHEFSTDFFLILKQDQIVSATNFELSVWEGFQKLGAQSNNQET